MGSTVGGDGDASCPGKEAQVNASERMVRSIRTVPRDMVPGSSADDPWVNFQVAGLQASVAEGMLGLHHQEPRRQQTADGKLTHTFGS